MPESLLQESLAQVLSCELCEIFKNIFFKEHLRATASVSKYSNDNLHVVTTLLKIDSGTGFFLWILLNF